VQTLSETMSVI